MEFASSIKYTPIEQRIYHGKQIFHTALKFEKHKMNVQLAAQTLSSSVANAIEFLASSQEYKNKFPKFEWYN